MKTKGYPIDREIVNLKDLDLDQLENLVTGLGEKKYRARQLAKWLFQKGASTFAEMTDLPLYFRQRLQEVACAAGVGIIKKQVSQQDSTRKYLFSLADGNAVEGVLMLYKHGLTACVSTQVGCRMGCRLCASGLEGLVRNLGPGEIYDQVVAMQKDAGRRVSNVVLMGSGEPLDNYDNVISFIKKVSAPYGLNIGLRHITLSTCGLVPRIWQLGREKMPLTLAISLHAPNNELRNRLVPVNKKYPLEELLPACKAYAGLTGRRVTFEYALVADFNDLPSHAKELAHELKDIFCLVNLIPANPVPELGVSRSPAGRVTEFKTVLERHGITVTIRRELGTDIDAACGQLRRRVFSPKRK